MTSPAPSRPVGDALRYEAAGVLGAGLVSALGLTTRVRRVDAEGYLECRRRGTALIFVFWHGHLLPLIHGHRNEGIVTFISEHADGEYLTHIARHLGYDAVRGSSTRGATRGLRGLIRAAREGRDLGLTPDGPRGPARVFKPGALAAAQATGLPLVPVGAGTSGAWRLRSWDSFLVPRPFATVCLAYGAPRTIPEGTTRDELEAMATALGEELDALERRATAEARA